jgi:hypothetical protein
VTGRAAAEAEFSATMQERFPELDASARKLSAVGRHLRPSCHRTSCPPGQAQAPDALGVRTRLQDVGRPIGTPSFESVIQFGRFRFRPFLPRRPYLAESILLSPPADASVWRQREGVQMRVNLTERFAKSATTEGRKSPIFYDLEMIGFGIQVRANGRKSFTLDYTL